MHQQPSFEAYQIVIQAQMGTLITEYRKKPTTQKEKVKKRTNFFILIFLYLFIIAFLAFIAVTVIDNLDSFKGFLFSSPLIALGCLSFFLCFILLVFWLPIDAYCKRNPGILHCTEGLIFRRGGRTTTIRWREIENVSEISFDILDNLRDYHCTVHVYNKKYALYKNIENTRELGRIIEREVTKRKISSQWQSLQQNEKLKFGPLSISKEGLIKGRKLVLWEQISQVHIFRGYIVIAKEDAAQRWPLVWVARIPNFFLFIALVYQLTDGRISYEAPDFKHRDYLLELIRFLLCMRRKAGDIDEVASEQ